MTAQVYTDQFKSAYMRNASSQQYPNSYNLHIIITKFTQLYIFKFLIIVHFRFFIKLKVYFCNNLRYGIEYGSLNAFSIYYFCCSMFTVTSLQSARINAHTYSRTANILWIVCGFGAKQMFFFYVKHSISQCHTCY